MGHNPATYSSSLTYTHTRVTLQPRERAPHIARSTCFSSRFFPQWSSKVTRRLTHFSFQMDTPYIRFHTGSCLFIRVRCLAYLCQFVISHNSCFQSLSVRDRDFMTVHDHKPALLSRCSDVDSLPLYFTVQQLHLYTRQQYIASYLVVTTLILRRCQHPHCRLVSLLRSFDDGFGHRPPLSFLTGPPAFTSFPESLAQQPISQILLVIRRLRLSWCVSAC